MIAQDLSDEFLNVVVASASDDRSDEFDFDADFPIVIDLAFHTTVYGAVPNAQGNAALCSPLFESIISAAPMRFDLEFSAKMEPSRACYATRLDRIC